MNQNSNKITNKNIMVENINRLLYQKNWSIRQLADEAELPYESVKKLVGGKVNNPTIYTISKVCDALNCSIDYLLGRSVINTIDKKSLTPTGYVQDGMVFDSISTNIVNISAYKKDFGDIVLCGIKIVGRNLSPTYLDNDILLIGKDRFPESGETGIFLIGNKVYIRKYIPGIRLELAPINGDKNSLFIDNIDDVHYFGRVLTVVRDA